MVKILMEAASQLLEGRSGVLLSHFVLCVFSSYKGIRKSVLSPQSKAQEMRPSREDFNVVDVFCKPGNGS